METTSITGYIGNMAQTIELMAGVTEEMNAAIFVVLHTPKTASSDVVISRLQRNPVFICKLAEDNEIIKAKQLYLRVPDHNLILMHGEIILRNIFAVQILQGLVKGFFLFGKIG